DDLRRCRPTRAHVLFTSRAHKPGEQDQDSKSGSRHAHVLVPLRHADLVDATLNEPGRSSPGISASPPIPYQCRNADREPDARGWRCCRIDAVSSTAILLE